MALALLLAGSAERDALVEQHVIADFRGLADHHAHPVIDKAPPADGGAGMDLDSRNSSIELRNNSR